MFKNPRDGSQIQHLGRQMFPGNIKLILDAYKLATSSPHSYLVIDLKQDTPEYARLRQSVIPSAGLCKNYIFVDPSSLEVEKVSLPRS